MLNMLLSWACGTAGLPVEAATQRPDLPACPPAFMRADEVEGVLLLELL